MEISAAHVKELREQTGVGFMDCKKALQEAGGDLQEAVHLLRKMGKAKAAARAGREAGEGRIESYVHMGGKIAVIVEINCETDFVARSDEFETLARDVAIHIAAANPRYVAREDVDQAGIEVERKLYREQAEEGGKPEKIIDRIVEGKLNRYFAEVCLLEQAFVKDQDRTIGDVLTDAIAKIGENIRIRRFARFALGDPDSVLAVSDAPAAD